MNSSHSPRRPRRLYNNARAMLDGIVAAASISVLLTMMEIHNASRWGLMHMHRRVTSAANDIPSVLYLHWWKRRFATHISFIFLIRITWAQEDDARLKSTFRSWWRTVVHFFFINIWILFAWKPLYISPPRSAKFSVEALFLSGKAVQKQEIRNGTFEAKTSHTHTHVVSPLITN